MAAPPELVLPQAATLTDTRSLPASSYILPVSPYADRRLDIVAADGDVTLQAWTIPNSVQTTLQLFQPLREALLEAGWEELFACVAPGCGGFDFRYAMELLPEPAMHVDFSDYRYLAAEREGADGPERLGVVVSRSAASGHVHLVHIEPARATETATAPATAPTADPVVADPGPMAAALDDPGRLVLEGLVFATGSATLEDTEFSAISTLAEYLQANPGARIVLVGHTDAEGTLDNNIALSRRRAQSVVDRLVERYGIDRSRLRAEGVGYLSPRASNLTAEGRARNRRVEAVRVQTE